MFFLTISRRFREVYVLRSDGETLLAGVFVTGEYDVV